MADINCDETIALKIEHLPSKRAVSFTRLKMTGFSDTVSPSWTTEAVYGRMDPITTYQNTTRAISLSFDLGPFTDSDDRAALALTKLTRLMQFQYPTYSDFPNAMSISRPPLLRVSFANYIRSGQGTGLVCYMDSMAYNPVDGMDATSIPKIKNGIILPQRISVSLSLKILHSQETGWDDSGNWIGGDNWGLVGFDSITADGLTSAIAVEGTLPDGEISSISDGILDGETTDG
jgi:hypothetical protein